MDEIIFWLLTGSVVTVIAIDRWLAWAFAQKLFQQTSAPTKWEKPQ